jgi:sialic acid synthase SpsE
VILSTGMATLAEIEEVRGILAFVFTDNDEPSRAKFISAFASPEGKQNLPDHVIILHGASDYPAKVDETQSPGYRYLGRDGRAPRLSDHSRWDSHSGLRR